MNEIRVMEIVGDFAENKDAARDLRETIIKPTLAAGEDVVLDFAGVNLATQSFIHALLSDVIRTLGADILDQMGFRNCNDTVKGLISIVVEYSQDSGEVEDA